MTPSEIKFIKICQYTLIVPIKFNHKKLIFESSKTLQNCSIILFITFFLAYIYSLRIWYTQIKNHLHVGNIEIIFMKITFTIFIFYGLIVIYEKIFQNSRLVYLVNRFYELHIRISALFTQNDYNHSLVVLTIIHIVVVPVLLISTNYILFREFHGVIVICLVITTYANYLTATITPVFLNIKSVTYKLKKLNQNVIMHFENNHDINQISIISKLHSDLVDMHNEVVSYYSIHILLFTFGVGSNFMWEIYAVLEIQLFQMTLLRDGPISLLIYGVNVLYITFEIYLFIWLIDAMVKESQRTVNLLHDLQVVTFDLQLRNDVSQNISLFSVLHFLVFKFLIQIE